MTIRKNSPPLYDNVGITDMIYTLEIQQLWHGIYWPCEIASLAVRLPTTAKQIKGLRVYTIVKNFAMLSFSLSGALLTSARAVSFIAGGPVGMSMRANQRMGSSESQFVRDATR
jgi:hypothetical protein